MTDSDEESQVATATTSAAGGQRRAIVLAPVWKHFIKYDGEAECMNCDKRVPTRGGTTSCMLSHLKRHHPSKYADVEKHMAGAPRTKKQANLVDLINKKKPYATNSSKYQELTKSVTRCLAQDAMPLYTVEKKGFKQMLETFDPRYALPGRKYFTGAIGRLYHETKASLEDEIKSVKHFSATTDLWSSINLIPYISFTAHYINEEWNLKTRCLETQFMPESHTAVNISDNLKNIIESWNLREDNLAAITTDSAANMISACSHARFDRVACFGHILNNAISNAMKDNRITRARRVVKKTVAVFSQSWKRQKALEAAQVRLNIRKHHLITDCLTRWGSLFKSFERLVEQQSAVREALRDDRDASYAIPSWQDMDVIKTVCDVLRPLCELTDALSADKTVTISAMLPLVQYINTSMEFTANDNDLAKSLKEKIAHYVNTKMGEQPNEILTAATFMDPRFREIIKDESKDDVIASITLQICNENEEILPNNELMHLTDTEHEQPAAQNNVEEPKRSSLGAFLRGISRSQSSPTSDELTVEDKCKREIAAYVAETLIDSDADPLMWWKFKQRQFPLLSSIAKKYLFVSAPPAAQVNVFLAQQGMLSLKSVLASTP